MSGKWTEIVLNENTYFNLFIKNLYYALLHMLNNVMK